MELRTEGVPTRRVLTGGDGAPLDGERVLALALRWAEQPLSLSHLRVGEPGAPVEGVQIRWEGSLPVVATSGPAKAWVEREAGQWVDPGRRTALEVGEVLLVESGGLTLEARLQRRSEPLPSARGHENLFFGLVMAHSLMLFTAVAVALVITPRTDEDSMWGNPSLLKRQITPFVALPERKTAPQLEERVKEVVTRTTTSREQRSPATTQKRTATDALKLLFGGGGGALFAKGLTGLDAALDRLQAPGEQVAGNGMSGVNSRDLGNGFDTGSLSIGKLGPGRGPGGAPPGGLRGHDGQDIVCKDCQPVLTPGYDRDLVLKVVRRHQNEIRFCYESELAKAPDLSGKITVAWVIGPSGAVESAQIAESGLSNQNVERCIVQRVRRWTFPEPRGGQEVAITFPWVFQLAGSASE